MTWVEQCAKDFKEGFNRFTGETENGRELTAGEFLWTQRDILWRCKLLSLPVITEKEHELIQAGFMTPPGLQNVWLQEGDRGSKCYYGYKKKYDLTFELRFPTLPDVGDSSTYRVWKGYEITMSKEEQTKLKNIQREYLRLKEMKDQT